MNKYDMQLSDVRDPVLDLPDQTDQPKERKIVIRRRNPDLWHEGRLEDNPDFLAVRKGPHIDSDRPPDWYFDADLDRRPRVRGVMGNRRKR